jgi:CBS domain-containing protein
LDNNPEQRRKKVVKSFSVKDLMVPLSEYATVPKDSTLFDAVTALEQAQAEFDATRYRHRAVLVLDENQQVVGKLSQLDVLRALEPKYTEMLGTNQTHHRIGFTKTFMKSILDQYKMWDSPLNDICRKAGGCPISSVMHTPTEGEYIDEGAALDEAIHQLVMGDHQSLLVTRDKEITGILRLTDVFAAVFHAMKHCYIDESP